MPRNSPLVSFANILKKAAFVSGRPQQNKSIFAFLIHGIRFSKTFEFETPYVLFVCLIDFSLNDCEMFQDTYSYVVT